MVSNNRSRNAASPPPEKKSREGRLVTYLAIFIVGFVAGVAFTVYRDEAPTSSPGPATSQQTQGQDGEMAEAITRLEAQVTARPEDYQSWIQLGHLYFDSDQPDKAIKAYQQSLELHEGDANLLTDLGVMYRRAGQPHKAIEYFDLAIAKDVRHEPSRFNKGVVLLYDLGDRQGALDSWQALLGINPQAKAADGQPISELVEKIKAAPAAEQKSP